MQVHQDVLAIVNKTILPQVLRVHEMKVPYPAELWVDGECQHQKGVAMFDISDLGFLTAEYFAYDGDEMSSLGIGLQRVTAKLVIARHRGRDTDMAVE